MKVKKLIEKICSERSITYIFGVLATIQFSVLFYYSIGVTGISTIEDEFTYLHSDFIIGNVLWLAMVVLGTYFIRCLSNCIAAKRKIRVSMDKMAIAVSVFVVLLGIYWIYANPTAPLADQANIVRYASEFNNGDFTGLNKGEYVGTDTHQLGIITVLRILFKFFGDRNVKAFRYFSALMLGILCFSGYWITKILSEHDRTSEIYYFLFVILCVPLYIYVEFIYGEVSSTAMISAAFCLMLECMKKCRPWKLVLLAIVCGIAVQLRMNSWVFIIGFVVAICVKLFSRHDRWIVLTGISVLIGVFLFNGITHMIYDRKIPEDSKTVPAILYIAMGTNYDKEQPGWFNGYNHVTFQANDYNPDTSKKVAQQTIKEFAGKCREDEQFASDFFTKKLLSQWEVPMYHSISMNNYISGEQAPIVRSIYSGALQKPTENFMNVYQLVIYGGILFLLVVKRKKWTEIDNYSALIGIFGGMLFTLIWEAKARYVFPYFIVMLPYAAVGLRDACEMAVRAVKKYRR